MKCGYCGNGSGKTDKRGNCVSCGASLDKPEPITSSWTEYVGVMSSTDANFDFRFPALYEAPPNYHEPGLGLTVEVPKTFLERVNDTLRNWWNA